MRSALLGIVCQRLLRRVCDCAEATADEDRFLGLPVSSARIARECDLCKGTGYAGRALVAELLQPREAAIGKAILARQEASRIEELAVGNGMTTLWDRAVAAVADGTTTPDEVRRVFGLRMDATRPGSRQGNG